jgi:hypothetical protein
MKSVELAQAQANLEKTRAETQKLRNVGLDPDQVSRDWNAQRLQIIKSAQEMNQTLDEVDLNKLRNEWIEGLITDHTNINQGLQTKSSSNGNDDEDDALWSSTQLSAQH